MSVLETIDTAARKTIWSLPLPQVATAILGPVLTQRFAPRMLDAASDRH